ncbi:Y-family DNA polymerase [Rhodoferax sp.]|uniref:Y-family DNA polymerase n=1 Tax=Rhodoferax sp. TaxID=50421 RepID=UPI00374D0BD3
MPEATDPVDADALLQALAWALLQFSPRVCRLEQAVLLEAEASVRLFHGKRDLVSQVQQQAALWAPCSLAVAPTALGALALLKQHSTALQGCKPQTLQATLDGLPMHCLAALAHHLPTLQRLGCRSLGQVRALPRGGVSRRFGAGVLDALDRAYGLKPEIYPWVALPEQFRLRLEFSGRIEVAQGMLFGVQRLLLQLKAWLLARQSGAIGVRLHWEHDMQRRSEAAAGSMEVRTAEATRDTAHLAKLLAEHLARTPLAAPVVAITLEALGVERLQIGNQSLLPEDRVRGESLQQFVERVSARLGPEQVLRAQAVADHRPQQMQTWAAASTAAASKPITPDPAQASHPAWILRSPLPLGMDGHRPVYQGPLTLLAGPERIEADWWDGQGDDLTLRDYFIAHSATSGLLWVYRERLQKRGAIGWYLHGVYG